jgi:hypothetical protein
MEGNMTGAFLAGLAMIGLGIFMFVVAIPRKGEVVGFLRNRSLLETSYTLALLVLLVVGSAGVVSEWTAQ